MALALALVVFLFVGGSVAADEVVGVTEPVEEVELAFSEAGVIAEIPVEEGDVVEKGQVLARLDNRILEVGLKIARVRAKSGAGQKSARAQLGTKQRRLKELERISKGGGVNTDELSTAGAEVEIAEAKLMEADVQAKENQLKVEQIQAQIERRTLSSPIDGIVEKTFRDEAAAVGGGADPVMTVVRLNQLALVVYVDAAMGAHLEVGQKARVTPLSGGDEGTAVVAFVSPVTDPSSGTTRIRLLLDNRAGKHRSGRKYRVAFAEGEEAASSAGK